MWSTHRVKPGESLASIAKKYGTSITAIRETNSLTTNVLRPNQTLLVGLTAIDQAKLSGNPMLSTAKSNRTFRLTYTVRRGDSLARIADRFNVSVAAIAEWNGMTPDVVLKSGRRLVLHLPASAKDVG
jgi:membrane-bound lytic murein transglycosylase D